MKVQNHSDDEFSDSLVNANCNHIIIIVTIVEDVDEMALYQFSSVNNNFDDDERRETNDEYVYV